MQYQSLMEARPQGLLEMLEPMLVRHVAIAGALHCLPFLAALPSLLPDISDEQLKDVCNSKIKFLGEIKKKIHIYTFAIFIIFVSIVIMLRFICFFRFADGYQL